jgi:hypothetical protein
MLHPVLALMNQLEIEKGCPSHRRSSRAPIGVRVSSSNGKQSVPFLTPSALRELQIASGLRVQHHEASHCRCGELAIWVWAERWVSAR